MAQTKKEQEQQPQAPPPPPPPPIKRVVVAVLPGKEELVASTPNQRNWRGILIALLVIVAVLGLIVFSIVLLSPPEEGPRVKGRKFTLDDVLGPHYRARRFNGTWVSVGSTSSVSLQNGDKARKEFLFVGICEMFICYSSATRIQKRVRKEPPCKQSILRWYRHRWIGRVGEDDVALFTWPPRSPYLTPCDFFLLGYIKDRVSVTPLPRTLVELRERIDAAVMTIDRMMLQNVLNELDYGLDMCRVTRGAHIDHL
ncbi:hypothetical protein B7P43_G06653 [Cryptotermes secundus]|uniref:Uncharacterized protein n=1 Tax=Cryptotermes secundus TaxID=105785 RepID=A0A2J7QI45_9NEOP|nr:hypothetical protein B7P43_G06653 [Cryptotermes secundus]